MSAAREGDYRPRIPQPKRGELIHFPGGIGSEPPHGRGRRLMRWAIAGLFGAGAATGALIVAGDHGLGPLAHTDNTPKKTPTTGVDQPTPPTQPAENPTPATHENKDVTAQYSAQLSLFGHTLKEAGVNPGNLTATEVWGQTYNAQGQEKDGYYVVFKDGNEQLATYGQYQEGDGQSAIRFSADKTTNYEGSKLAVQYYNDQRAIALKDGKPMPLMNAVVIPQGAVVTTTPFVYHGADGDYYGFTYTWTIDGKTQVIDVLPSNADAQVWGNASGEHVPQDNAMLFDNKHTDSGDRLNASYDFYAGDGAKQNGSVHPGLPIVDGASGKVSVSIDGSKNAQLKPTSLTLTMPDGTQAPVELG